MSLGRWRAKRLHFTIETAVGGHEGRWCWTAVRAMVAYARNSPHCNGASQVRGAVLLGNALAGC